MLCLSLTLPQMPRLLFEQALEQSHSHLMAGFNLSLLSNLKLPRTNC